MKTALAEVKGTDRVGLVGLEFLGRSDVEGLIQELLDRQLRLSFSSLRADCVTHDFVKLLKNSGAKLATIAPEAGSQRMRDAINKNLNEETILNAAETIVSGGIPDLKLYFMIGLPFETEDDVYGIYSLVKKIREIVRPIGRARKHMGNITASVGPFVPKAWTPMQWAEFASEKTILKRRNLLEKELKKMSNVRIKFESYRESHKQAVLSRGDRRLALAIKEFALGNASWKKAFGQHEFTRINNEKLPDDSTFFPWDIIGNRVKKSYLWTEWNKSKTGKTTSFCATGSCRRCGACGNKRNRQK